MIFDGVEMRGAVAGDARGLAEAVVRNRAHMAHCEPDRAAVYYTEEGQLARLAEQLTARADGRCMPWVLTEADGGRVIGTITLNNIVLGPLRSCSIGYWVDEAWCGRGLATAALHAVCRAAREDFGLHRVEAGTLVDNHASQRVLAKAGFERYGTAPRYLHINGAWRDHHLFQRILHDDAP